MTRKDYVAIAKAISLARSNSGPANGLSYYDGHEIGIDHVVARLADQLANDNPSFDKARFTKACQ